MIKINRNISVNYEYLKLYYCMSIKINSNNSFKNKVNINLFVYIYIYIMENNLTMWRKILKNKVIQSKEFNMKKNRRYNVSVSINHHQDLQKVLRSIVRSPMDAKVLIMVYWNLNIITSTFFHIKFFTLDYFFFLFFLFIYILFNFIPIQ